METMLTFFVAAIALAVGVWAWRQFVDLMTSLALRPARAVVIELCGVVVADEEESENARRFAAWLVRLSLNEPLMRSILKAAESGLLDGDNHSHKIKSLTSENQQILDASTNLVALMMLTYHPKHGGEFRSVLRSLKGRMVEQQHLAAAASIRPPKPLKHEARVISNALEESAFSNLVCA